MKYVVLKNEGGLRMPVIVPDVLSHYDAAKGHAGHGWQPVSAGFLAFEAKGIVTTGHSESLNLKPHPRDRELLACFLMGQEGAMGAVAMEMDEVGEPLKAQ